MLVLNLGDPVIGKYPGPAIVSSCSTLVAEHLRKQSRSIEIVRWRFNIDILPRAEDDERSSSSTPLSSGQGLTPAESRIASESLPPQRKGRDCGVRYCSQRLSLALVRTIQLLLF